MMGHERINSQDNQGGESAELIRRMREDKDFCSQVMAKFNYALIIKIFKDKKQEKSNSFFATLVNRFKIRDTPSEFTPVGKEPIVKVWTVKKGVGGMNNSNINDEESKSPAGVFSVKVE